MGACRGVEEDEGATGGVDAGPVRGQADVPLTQASRHRVIVDPYAIVTATFNTSIPAVAAELFVAPSTVKTHVQRLYEKLGVSDRAAAVAESMRQGLLT